MDGEENVYRSELVDSGYAIIGGIRSASQPQSNIESRYHIEFGCKETRTLVITRFFRNLFFYPRLLYLAIYNPLLTRLLRNVIRADADAP